VGGYVAPHYAVSSLHTYSGTAATAPISRSVPHPSRVGRNYHYDNGYYYNPVVYPWWLYDGYDNTPVTSSYYDNQQTPATTDASASGSVFNNPVVHDPNAAREAMDDVYLRAQTALYASPQWTAANAELKSAQAELQSATDQFNSELMNRPDYASAVEQKRAAQDSATALHRQPGDNQPQIMAAAQEDLAASQKIASIERQASAGNEKLEAARARVQVAAAAVTALREGLRTQVTSDPAWQAARQQLASR
jgi:hypothetical protein